MSSFFFSSPVYADCIFQLAASSLSLMKLLYFSLLSSSSSRAAGKTELFMTIILSVPLRSFRIFYKPNHHFPAISRFLTDRENRIAVEHTLSDDHLVIDFVFLHSILKGRGAGIQCLITAVDENGFRTVRKIALLQTQPLKTIFTIFIRTSVSQKRIISLWNSPTFL